VVLKPQLFRDIPPNEPLKHSVFEYLVELIEHHNDTGHKIEYAASVFDMYSLSAALAFKVSHIKIACRPDLYWLAGKVPREVPVHVSFDARGGSPIRRGILPPKTDISLACVPEYPADMNDYMGVEDFSSSYSDHTIGLDLFEYATDVWEKHFVLKRDDPNNPDSGPFSMIPEDLEQIL
jgi:sialic acid synthase SpsE